MSIRFILYITDPGDFLWNFSGVTDHVHFYFILVELLSWICILILLMCDFEIIGRDTQHGINAV